MRRNFNGAMLALILAAVTTAPALARGNDLVIKDGMGEQIEIRNGFFGRKTTVVKDRLGNGYSTKTGLFGSKDTNVSVMGNNLTRKKGIFGSTEVQGNTIFGDKVTTKKGLFGRRTTEVDVSGTSNVLKGLWSKFGPELMGKTPAPISAPVAPAMGLPDAVVSSPADLAGSY